MANEATVDQQQLQRTIDELYQKLSELFPAQRDALRNALNTIKVGENQALGMLAAADDLATAPVGDRRTLLQAMGLQSLIDAIDASTADELRDALDIGSASVTATGSDVTKSQEDWAAQILEPNKSIVTTDAGKKYLMSEVATRAVAKQDFIPLQASGRVLGVEFQRSTTAYSGTSSNYANATGIATYIPRSATSNVIVFMHADVRVAAEASDNFVGTVFDLRCYNGTDFVSVGTPISAGFGVTGASFNSITQPSGIAFSTVIKPSQRRFDGIYASELGAVSIRLLAQATSGATWYCSAADFTIMEVGTDAATPLPATVGGIEHILLYGQSLSNGATNAPAITTSPIRSSRNVMFNAGVRTLRSPHVGASEVNTVLDDGNIAYLAPLAEQTNGSAGETPATLMAYQLTTDNGLPSDEGVLVSGHGIGGRPYEELKKGTVPYSNMIKALRRARVIARMNGREHKTLGMSFIHGEADRAMTQSEYLTVLRDLQSTLTDDIRAIDGRWGEVTIFCDQISNWTRYDVAESAVPFAQLQAGLEDASRIYCVGPKYMLESTDGIHITAQASAQLGAYHGEVMRRVKVLGEDWKPMHVESAKREGSKVILKFHVPNGPIVLDTTLVTNPGNYGLSWRDAGDGNAVTIQSVTVTGDTELTVALSAVPTATGQKIGIADVGVVGASAGPATGPRSNIRDSYSLKDYYGKNLYNWACHQRVDVI